MKYILCLILSGLALASYPVLETGGGGVSEYETNRTYTEGTIIWETTDFYKVLGDYTSVNLSNDLLNNDLIKMVDPLDYLVGLTGNVQVQLDAITSRLTTNEADILSNSSDIATNVSNIATNNTNIQTNATAISNNATNIATNTTEISDNAADILSNAGNISTNQTDIAGNVSDIMTNSAAIATNTSDIASLVSADGSIDTHSDVDVSTTTPSINETLVFDGTNFVNKEQTTDDVPEGVAANLLFLDQPTTTETQDTISSISSINGYAQEFQLSEDKDVQAVGFFMSRNATATGTLTATMFELVGGLPSTVLGTSVAVDITTISETSDYVEFTFPSQISLTGGVIYAASINGENVTSGSIILPRAGTGGTLGLFRRVTSSGAWQDFTGSRSMPIRIYEAGLPNNAYLTASRVEEIIAEYLANNPPPSSGGNLISVFKELQPLGTQGGTSGDFNDGYLTRTLNTQSGDTSFASLSSNEILLTAGTYFLRASAPAFNVAFHQIRLFDATNSTVVVDSSGAECYGGAAFTGNTTSANRATGSFYFTLGSPTSVRIEHITNNAVNSSGLGTASFSSPQETYTTVEIHKLN